MTARPRAMDRVRALFAGVAPAARARGLPPSGNGASSFHLGWDIDLPLSSASVVFEVVEPPAVDRLYFWALQTDFADAASGTRAGGAHLGLQWHRDYPGNTAVCWGGYAQVGGELRGSDSPLRSATGNPNVRNLAWVPARRYRLTVARVMAATLSGSGEEVLPDGFTAWRAQVADETTGDQVTVRDLYAAGDQIVGVTMWSEVFARCDDPTVTVRWSEPSGRALDGRVVKAHALRVNYQAHHDGGCANTDSAVDGDGVLQRTNVERRTPQGDVLRPG